MALNVALIHPYFFSVLRISKDCRCTYSLYSLRCHTSILNTSFATHCKRHSPPHFYSEINVTNGQQRQHKHSSVNDYPVIVVRNKRDCYISWLATLFLFVYSHGKTFWKATPGIMIWEALITFCWDAFRRYKKSLEMWASKTILSILVL